MSPSPAKEPTLISSLPDDLLLNCLARVSRLHHPTLYFVSKKFRSIIKSQELYNIRSLLNRTEKFLYICLRVHDCRSYTWHAAPNMRVGGSFYSTASVVDGKIYVAGGCEEPIASLNWIEVFDPETQSWSSVTSPNIEIPIMKSLEFEGKLYLFWDDVCVVYDPKEGRWNPSGINLSTRSCYGVIDKALFVWDHKEFKWYDTNVSSWKKVNGLERVLYYSLSHDYKIMDLGGKMAVLWDRYSYSDYYAKEENLIWCCAIALERRYKDDGDEMWGKVEWSDILMRTDASCSLSDHQGVVLSVTL